MATFCKEDRMMIRKWRRGRRLLSRGGGKDGVKMVGSDGANFFEATDASEIYYGLQDLWSMPRDREQRGSSTYKR